MGSKCELCGELKDYQKSLILLEKIAKSVDYNSENKSFLKTE